MDFEITTNLDTLRNQTIDANFSAVAAWLDNELKPYTGMVVTADMIPTAKTYRANLRKVKDRIDSYRKEAKNAALAPYTEFESKCKALTSKLDAAADNLDVQIKEYEQREKEAKIAELKAFYEAQDAEARVYRPWENICNSRWENKGYAIETAKDEIAAAIVATTQDIETIRSIGGENTAYLLDFYKTHDLRATIQKSNELIWLKLQEDKRREAAEKQAAAAEAESDDVEIVGTRAHVVPREQVAETPSGGDETIYTVDFRVRTTREKLQALGDFMKSQGIDYGKIK